MRDGIKKIYLLGIGGVSMSSLAVMLKEQSYDVSGSDEAYSRGVEILKNNNIGVDFDVNYQKIANADLVVFSSAIKEDDPRMILCRKLGKKVWQRGELLGEISNSYEKVVAVSGSHGKTTTTAMIFEILNVAGLNPSLHLGGYRVENGKNYHLGGKEFFVTEACEYHNNFLFLHPYISVITNIEKEHIDFFKSFSNQLKSFEKFKVQSKNVVDNFENYNATNIRHDNNGRLMFCLRRGNKKIMDLYMNISEDVNVQNCIYAHIVAKKLGIPDCLIKRGLERFKGVKTRFERKKCAYFDVCICDYAHHPTEIMNSILSARKIFKDKKVVTVFQPHTYSRTKTLLPEFLKVFRDQPCPIFYKTYSARESESDGLTALQFTEKLQKINKNAKYFDNFCDLKSFLLNFPKKDTALLFLGAGDLPEILHKNSFVE